MLKTYFILLAAFFCCSVLHAQQLYFEGFSGWSRTNFDIPPYEQNPETFIPVGGRFAFGADHFQLGAEYQQMLTRPNWPDETTTSTSTEFETTYYGAFLRAKISRYPAMRFGLTFRAGAGFYNTTRHSDVPNIPPTTEYDQALGFNGGVGASIPLIRPLMLELGYTYYYVEYDEIRGQIGAMNGSFHSIQAGLSFNFVFGKRADDYEHLRGNWKFRNGWRG